VDFGEALRDEGRVEPEHQAGLGVYVHFPFCRSICPYCDFAVEVAAELPHERYARAILVELELRAGEFEGLGPVRSVFFGGGTPSLWDPVWVGNVLRGLELRLGLPAGLEVSLEANPEDRDADRLRALRELGINRISWGVQSFQQPVLRKLGRGHRSDQAALAVELSLQLGFPAVSVDLIYGAADQDAAGAVADAARAAAFGIHHVSAYALTLEELAVDVPMAKAQRAGKIQIPDGDAQAEMGRGLRETLAAAGFERYEVSNFARGGARSVHNLGYWQGRPYLGLGVGAAGATDARRYTNGRGVKAYLEALEGARLPDGDHDPFDEDIRFRERVFLGLRLVEGLELGTLEARFGAERVAQLRARAAAVVAGGLARLGDGRLRLTEAGLDLHSEIAARLL
jgi:oxygen-independent coproporphyrinogen-3 oxidase